MSSVLNFSPGNLWRILTLPALYAVQNNLHENLDRLEGGIWTVSCYTLFKR